MISVFDVFYIFAFFFISSIFTTVRVLCWGNGHYVHLGGRHYLGIRILGAAQRHGGDKGSVSRVTALVY